LILAPFSIIQYPPIDGELYWSFRILPEVYKIIKSEDINVIFTTSAPWSVLISGLILQRFTGVPWVADMRDPWTTEELRYRSTGWRYSVDKYIERKCLGNADIVIGVHPKWIEDLGSRSEENHSSGKFVLITNGFDESDFSNHSLSDLNSDNGIKISHIGSMFEGSLEPLLTSLENLDNSILINLSLEFIGYIHPKDLDELNKSPVRRIINYQPQRIPHKKALEEMEGSHILFLSLPFEYFPGKIFEYMRTGRPVLAIVHNCSVRELIEKSQVGCVINQDDTDKLSEVLKQIVLDYDGFLQEYYHPNWDYISQFDRRNLTYKLSCVFDRVSK
jgi:glycosyltransferase involved in cell wall biosynthesis